MVRQVECRVRFGTIWSAVALQIEAMCPWPPEEIYWSFAQQEIKATGKILLTLVIVPRANIDPWIDLFRSAKLPLSGASLSPASCAHGVRAYGGPELDNRARL